MKIVCDSCGAKYQVADEKVKNKVFKIRCKRCENVIIVRGGEVTSSAAADVAQAQQQASDESLEKTRQAAFAAGDESVNEGVHWHIVVDGQQVGLKTAEDIAGYLGRGEVTADAFVWREGMGDGVIDRRRFCPSIRRGGGCCGLMRRIMVPSSPSSACK